MKLTTPSHVSAGSVRIHRRSGKGNSYKKLLSNHSKGISATARREQQDRGTTALGDNSDDSGLGCDNTTEYPCNPLLPHSSFLRFTTFQKRALEEVGVNGSKKPRLENKTECEGTNNTYSFGMPQMSLSTQNLNCVAPPTFQSSMVSAVSRSSTGRRSWMIGKRMAGEVITLSSQLSSTSRNGKVQIQILNQPEQQHRARYQTEGSRGAVKDRTGSSFPVVKISGYNKPTVLQVFIGSDQGHVTPHKFYQACRVTGKNSTPCHEKNIDGTIVIEIDIEPSNDMTITCDCVGILKERNVDVEHRFREECPTRNKKKSTRCRMVFRTTIINEDESTETLQVTSQPIACTQPPGVPEISKKSLTSCAVSGGQELFILGKNFLKDTQVIFQTNDWEQYVTPDKEFLQQTHLVCTVPAYKTLDIKEPVMTKISVVSGNRSSEPHTFTYIPTLAQSIQDPSLTTTVPLPPINGANDDSAVVGSSNAMLNEQVEKSVARNSSLDTREKAVSSLWSTSASNDGHTLVPNDTEMMMPLPSLSLQSVLSPQQHRTPIQVVQPSSVPKNLCGTRDVKTEVLENNVLEALSNLNDAAADMLISSASSAAAPPGRMQDAMEYDNRAAAADFSVMSTAATDLSIFTNEYNLAEFKGEQRMMKLEPFSKSSSSTLNVAAAEMVYPDVQKNVNPDDMPMVIDLTGHHQSNSNIHCSPSSSTEIIKTDSHSYLYQPTGGMFTTSGMSIGKPDNNNNNNNNNNRSMPPPINYPMMPLIHGRQQRLNVIGNSASTNLNSSLMMPDDVSMNFSNLTTTPDDNQKPSSISNMMTLKNEEDVFRGIGKLFEPKNEPPAVSANFGDLTSDMCLNSTQLSHPSILSYRTFLPTEEDNNDDEVSSTANVSGSLRKVGGCRFNEYGRTTNSFGHTTVHDGCITATNNRVKEDKLLRSSSLESSSSDSISFNPDCGNGNNNSNNDDDDNNNTARGNFCSASLHLNNTFDLQSQFVNNTQTRADSVLDEFESSSESHEQQNISTVPKFEDLVNTAADSYIHSSNINNTKQPGGVFSINSINNDSQNSNRIVNSGHPMQLNCLFLNGPQAPVDIGQITGDHSMGSNTSVSPLSETLPSLFSSANSYQQPQSSCGMIDKTQPSDVNIINTANLKTAAAEEDKLNCSPTLSKEAEEGMFVEKMSQMSEHEIFSYINTSCFDQVLTNSLGSR